MEILHGFNPTNSHTKVPSSSLQCWLQQVITPDDFLSATAEEIQAYVDKRDESGFSASERLAAHHHSQEQATKPPGGSYRRPKAGDLVLPRDLARDKHLGRKLDPRWTEPRLVDKISKNGMSTYIRAIYEPPDRGKRYHIDDLKVYTSSNPNTVISTAHASMITYDDTNEMLSAIGRANLGKGNEPSTLQTSGGRRERRERNQGNK